MEGESKKVKKEYLIKNVSPLTVLKQSSSNLHSLFLTNFFKGDLFSNNNCLYSNDLEYSK